MLLDHCYAFGLLPWPSGLKKVFEEGDPVTYFGPALDPHQAGSGQKTTTLIRDFEYCKTLIIRVALFSRGQQPRFIHETSFSRFVIYSSIILAL